MRIRICLSLVIFSSVALASNCPSGDALLKNNTSLSSLCPNGFSSKSGGSIENAMKNQTNNVSMVYAEAQNQGVPTELALAVSYHESVGFNSCAGSPTGVKGPMQLTKATAKSYGYDRDINEQNIKGGMTVLKNAYNKCGYDYACLAKYYNGSPTPGEQAGWARGVQAATTKLQNNPSLVASACSGTVTTANCNPNDTGNPNLSGTTVADNGTGSDSTGTSQSSTGQSGTGQQASAADMSSPAEHPPTREMATIILNAGEAAIEPEQMPEGTDPRLTNH